MSIRINSIIPSFIAGTLTACCLAFIQVKVSNPMILAERFVPGAGWLEIVILGCYAGFLFTKMRDPKNVAKWRLRIWKLFSVVFFGQLILGLSGINRMLMTGELHLPIPAVILAGPIYRGEGFFMPILFLSTVILVGPAWCSHLCYIGAWDNTAALAKKRARSSKKAPHIWRIGIFILVISIAFSSRMMDTHIIIPIVFALVFGMGGLGVMLTATRQTGRMVHCTIYCPIGLLANICGRISPFRLSIENESCSNCMKCSSVCRYDALKKENIDRGKPGLTCTLCGDCLGSCDGSSIRYKYTPWLSPEKSRILFLVLTISLHTVFLGVARI